MAVPCHPRLQRGPLTAYVAALPVIREAAPSVLDLADDDLIEEPVAVKRSTPPPPPPIKSTIVPKAKGIASPKIPPLAVPNITPIASIAPPLAKITPIVAPAPAPAAVLAPVNVNVPVPVPDLSLSSPPPDSHVQLRDPKPKLESLVDPSEALFEGMYELNYADTPWAAARICATILAQALGARTVIVHAHDLANRQLRAIGVHGEGEFDVLGSSDGSEDDLIASAVICNERAVTMRFDGELPRLAPRRLGMIGQAPHTLVAVPAMAWGRCVAVIEIIDADERLASRVADSAAYVAERLATFLSNRAAA